MEPFKKILTTFTFSINTVRHFMKLCKKRLKISSFFKVSTLNLESLRNNGTHVWPIMWRNLHFKSYYWYCYCWKTLWNEYYSHSAQLVSSKQTCARRWPPVHAHCSFQVYPWCDASQYAKCTIGTRIRASWLLSRSNICSLRSFTDWLVATLRRSITLLYKHRIHSLKFSYLGPAETVKNCGRWTNKVSLHSKCFYRFPTNAKNFSLSLAQNSLCGFFANG